MVNVIMKHHKQVYPYYLSSRSLLCLMNINVKLLLQPFLADLTFIYISEKEKFFLWQNQNNFLPFFLPRPFSPHRIEYFILKKSDYFSRVTSFKATQVLE